MPPTNSACCGAPLSERLSPHHGTTRSPQTLAGFGQIALGEGQGFFALAACLGVGRLGHLNKYINLASKAVSYCCGLNGNPHSFLQ